MDPLDKMFGLSSLSKAQKSSNSSNDDGLCKEEGHENDDNLSIMAYLGENDQFWGIENQNQTVSTLTPTTLPKTLHHNDKRLPLPKEILDQNNKLHKILDISSKEFDLLPESRKEQCNENFEKKVRGLVQYHEVYNNWKPKRGGNNSYLYNFVNGINRGLKCAYRGEKHDNQTKITWHRYKRLVDINYPCDEIRESVAKEAEIASKRKALKAASLRLSTSATSSTRSKSAKMSFDNSKNEQPDRVSDTRHGREANLSEENMFLRAKVQTLEKEQKQNAKNNRSSTDGEIVLTFLKQQEKKVIDLEKESQKHFATIYELKDEKEALIGKVKEQESTILSQNKKIESMKQKLVYYKNKAQSLENNQEEFTSISRKRIRTSSLSSSEDHAEMKRWQEDRQFLIDQLVASTENYRKLLNHKWK